MHWNEKQQCFGDSLRTQTLFPWIYTCIRASGFAASRVIDVGCGNGSLVRYLLNREIECVGVDVSEQMLQICRAWSTPGRAKAGQYSTVASLSDSSQCAAFGVATFVFTLQDACKFAHLISVVCSCLTRQSLVLAVVESLDSLHAYRCHTETNRGPVSIGDCTAGCYTQEIEWGDGLRTTTHVREPKAYGTEFLKHGFSINVFDMVDGPTMGCGCHNSPKLTMIVGLRS